MNDRFSGENQLNPGVERPMGEVPTVLSMAENELEQSHKLISLLADRLTSITSGTESGGRPIDRFPTTSPLADRIVSLMDGITSLNHKIGNLIDKVQL